MTAIAVAVWSVLSWLAYALIGAGGSVIAGNADIVPDVPPELVEWVSWLAYFGAGVGEWIVVLVWAVVSAIMVGGAWVIARLVPQRPLSNARSS